ncbi:MAG: hypothetical protein M1834_002337 [Cirrosporium novae-zelandiae]|nr:MAG: hypothetical protein M1834_002337 [Cirrosporium novae-zelandiae]
MAFTLRRGPFVLNNAIKQSTFKSSISVRTFHNSSPKPFSNFFSVGKPTTSLITKSRTSQLQNAFRRSYYQQGSNTAYGATQGNLTQRLLYGAGIFGGTLVAINLLFNRETRDDGGMPSYERSYLNQTMMHTGLGIGMIGVAARAMHMNGWSYRLMAMNPWAVLGVGLAASIGSMMGTFYTDPDNYVAKYAFWSVFNVAQAATLSPLLFMSPALLARAGLYTVGMMGSIAFVGATAKQEKYLYLGAPLLAGCAVVAISGFAPLVLPATAVRSLAWSENIWLYGGLAVFGGFTLWDTQKILQHARMAERGMMKRDAVAESVSLELDFLNIFIRMVQILGMRQNSRR